MKKVLVVLNKMHIFQRRKVTGKVVLSRYDENTVPTAFQGPGKKLKIVESSISMTALV
jgi:hypothetical protein